MRDSINKRRHASRRTRKLSTSPYFSPTRARELQAVVPVECVPKDSDMHMEEHTASPESSFLPPDWAAKISSEVVTNADEEEVDSDAWSQNQAEYSLKNPLFRRLLYTYVDLYLRLFKLKPKLVQESLSNDPWKLLLAVMFLNKTAGKASIPIFRDIVARWPTAEDLSQADTSEIIPLIRSLGLQRIRAERMIALSKAYVMDPPLPDVLRDAKRRQRISIPASDDSIDNDNPFKQYYPATPVSHLPGTGPYALDSYRIFCTEGDEWKLVRPSDKELIRYLRWRWAYHECMQWNPITGPSEAVNQPYLNRLCDILTQT